MSALRQAAQQALEALEYTGMDVGKFNRVNAACAALRAALAAPEQEPVAWAFRYDDGSWHDPSVTKHSRGMLPLYSCAATPQRKPLSEAMKEQCPYPEANPTLRGAFYDGWLRAEAAYGITGEGA